MRIIGKKAPNRSALTRELVAYNNQYTPLERWQCVGFYALDADGHVVGGVQGNFEWDWLHITHRWVKDRGKGLGRDLVKTAETFAQQHGKRGLFLDTFDFQARPFYERLGFVVIGKIENVLANMRATSCQSAYSLYFAPALHLESVIPESPPSYGRLDFLRRAECPRRVRQRSIRDRFENGSSGWKPDLPGTA